MSIVRIIYCRNHHWSTPILRAAMWSPWSHQGMIMGDELGKSVIDATFFHNVSRRNLMAIEQDSTLYAIREIEVPRADKTYAFMRRQLGKKYDTRGVVGIGVHRDWQNTDDWFCSELVEAGLAEGGLARFKTDFVHRVTPQHSWMNTAGVMNDAIFQPRQE